MILKSAENIKIKTYILGRVSNEKINFKQYFEKLVDKNAKISKIRPQPGQDNFITTISTFPVRNKKWFYFRGMNFHHSHFLKT